MDVLATPQRTTSGPAEVIARLCKIVGSGHVLTRTGQIRRYATGYRSGAGQCLAVVRPASLIQLWRTLQACVASDLVMIIQAANTGLTGGSTPGAGYDRDVVIVSTLRIRGIRPIRDGQQVVCLAGASLNQLERVLQPLGREPHSVIGSSCIGASVVGGVCNNSGGALVRRGPAYTEMSLFAQVGPDGQLKLINHLGIDLGTTPEEILQRLEDPATKLDERLAGDSRRGSDPDYESHVRDIAAATPARYNADPRRLHEASGSAGKVAVFAVRLDTFPNDDGSTTFYLGTNDPAALAHLRRELLTAEAPLPIAAEYIHRDAFDLATRYGRDTFYAIGLLGADRLPWLYRAKSAVDGFARRLPLLPQYFSDRALQALSALLPQHLPVRLRQMRDRFEHHLLLKTPAAAVPATRTLLSAIWSAPSCGVLECSPRESAQAFRHRFVTAGAAVRYRAVHSREIEDIVALDIALPRNASDWLETLPSELEHQLVAKLYYGHFLCHVFHQDYLVRKGYDPLAFEHAMWALLDRRCAEYPAEHNVGHLYPAKPALERHYRSLDPTNAFNPGVGQLSMKRGWA